MSDDLREIERITSPENYESGKESEEAILGHLEKRVADMLDDNPELLFSWMYRLDVLEHKIQAVLKAPRGLNVPRSLAVLIWERQKKRLETKKKYRSS